MILNRISQVKVDKHTNRSIINSSDNGKLDPDIKEFVNSLDLTDEEILQKFDLLYNGTKLSPSEARRFIEFVRKQ